jgi:hypothetical protein
MFKEVVELLRGAPDGDAAIEAISIDILYHLIRICPELSEGFREIAAEHRSHSSAELVNSLFRPFTIDPMTVSGMNSSASTPMSTSLDHIYNRMASSPGTPRDHPSTGSPMLNAAITAAKTEDTPVWELLEDYTDSSIPWASFHASKCFDKRLGVRILRPLIRQQMIQEAAPEIRTSGSKRKLSL